MDGVGWSALGLFLLFLLLAAVVTAGMKALSLLSPVPAQESVGQAKLESKSLTWLQQRQVKVSSSLSFGRGIFVIVATCLGIVVALDIFSLNWGVVLVSVVILIACNAIVWIVSRAVARYSPEQTALFLSGLLMVVSILCWPMVRKYTKDEQAKAKDVFELETAVPLKADQHEMIKGIVELRQTTVREIMVPRVDIVAAEKNTPVNELIDLIVGAGYSRIPIYQDTIDNIVGVVNAKDILNMLKGYNQPFNLEQLIRPVYFIPESKKVDDLLREFKEKKITQAIVVDEYGGVAGLVGIKDVLEEIVGEIANEYDDNQPQIRRLSGMEAILDAKVSITALNEEFNVELSAEGFDTVGGLVLHQLGRMAASGDEIKINSMRFLVISTLGRRIQKIKVTKLEPTENIAEEKAGS